MKHEGRLGRIVETGIGGCRSRKKKKLEERGQKSEVVGTTNENIGGTLISNRGTWSGCMRTLTCSSVIHVSIWALSFAWPFKEGVKFERVFHGLDETKPSEI